MFLLRAITWHIFFDNLYTIPELIENLSYPLYKSRLIIFGFAFISLFGVKYLDKEKCNSETDVHQILGELFSKDVSLYKRGIYKLPEI